MPLNDVLLPLIGEPSEPTSVAIEKCVAAAADWRAKITALQNRHGCATLLGYDVALVLRFW